MSFPLVKVWFCYDEEKMFFKPQPGIVSLEPSERGAERYILKVQEMDALGSPSPDALLWLRFEGTEHLFTPGVWRCALFERGLTVGGYAEPEPHESFVFDLLSLSVKGLPQ